MPNPKQSIEQTFVALADPTRRAVIQTLSRGSATVSDLASPFNMALPSFTQHLGVLEAAGLIISRREGRSPVCTLVPQALKDGENWMATYRQEWESRMDRYQIHLEKLQKGISDDPEN